MKEGRKSFSSGPKDAARFFLTSPLFSSSLSGTLHEDEEVAEVYAAARSRESRYSGGARAECRGSLCACAAKSDGVFMKLIDSHLIATLHLSLSRSLSRSSSLNLELARERANALNFYTRTSGRRKTIKEARASVSLMGYNDDLFI